jgi:ketosteroid isomerase-like protein
MSDPKYKVFAALDPFFNIVQQGLAGQVGASYDNRFISVVTIEDRKIVRWRDYMDSLAAMTALGTPQPAR